MMDKPELSLIMPAYNEGGNIRSIIEKADNIVKKIGLRYELIVVDDGSIDDTAETARNTVTHDSVNLTVIKQDKNYGKGFAVKTGMLRSHGAVVLFADSGSCVPYSDALPYIGRIRRGELDIAIGSRRHKNSIIHRDQPLVRRVLSRLFHFAAVVIAGLPKKIKDSQCGFKVYDGEKARLLFSECRIKGFLFDVEILIRAHKKGFRIQEFPIEWTCDLDTRLNPGSDTADVVRDLLSLRKVKKDK